MKGPIIYTAEMDYGEKERARDGVFTEWYANRHGPDLFKLGARSVAGYSPVIGGLAVMSVYQFSDSDVFLTPAYTKMRDTDMYGPDVRATRAGGKSAQTLYRERLALPADDTLVDADWISALRFAAPEGQDEAIIAWLRGEGHGALKSHGVTQARYCTRTAQEIGKGSFRPRCLLLTEWRAQPPAAADLTSILASRFGATEPELFVGWRAYPWPDNKSMLRPLNRPS